MASNRNLKSDDVDGFMLATWDSAIDLADKYDVSIGIGVGMRKKRGEMVFRATAFARHANGADVPVATAEAIWPTHYAKTLHALLYALLVRLWRELDIWVEASAKLNSSPPSDEAPKSA